MSKVAVVYWSQTGNTKLMAETILDGAVGKGADASIFEANDFSAAKAAEFDAIAFGCPAMGAEELEDSEFEPMFSAVEGSLAGKKIALFGSYGWGDGQWMRDWEDRCRNNGINLAEKSVIANEVPDDAVLIACRDLGAALS